MTTLLLLLLGLGCAPDCPNGPMVASEAGLTVTEAEHPTGWGNPDCAECHAFDALHRTSCHADVDLEAVRAEVEADGEASCAGCHGDNGAAP